MFLTRWGKALRLMVGPCGRVRALHRNIARAEVGGFEPSVNAPSLIKHGMSGQCGVKPTLMMKLRLTAVAVLSLAAAPAHAGDGFDKEACTYDGYPLFGDVQIVDSFPDIKVQIVDSFPDLKVEMVDSFPDDCGQWKIVDSFPDVKVQYVDSFPDVKIEIVTSFPGWP